MGDIFDYLSRFSLGLSYDALTHEYNVAILYWHKGGKCCGGGGGLLAGF